MDSNGIGGSQRLVSLASQLRCYKPPITFDDEDEEKRIEEGAGKVVSQLGFAESVIPVAHHHPERFRPKKAAVLICLFEGDGGDLRVILTKRSSRLSTHSGEVSLPGGKTEEGDKDASDTATREAKEEIGLDPLLVNVVTVLEPFLSKISRKRRWLHKSRGQTTLHEGSRAAQRRTQASRFIIGFGQTFWSFASIIVIVLGR